MLVCDYNGVGTEYAGILGTEYAGIHGTRYSWHALCLYVNTMALARNMPVFMARVMPVLAC
jgi:hypothetical protein